MAAASLRKTAARRLLAFGVDYLVIAAYAGVLTAITFAVGGDRTPPATWSAKLTGHALAFATLTLPVVLYFAVSERIWGRTLGKAALRLRVNGPDGASPTLTRALTRNGLKFAPWELAHAAVWYVPGRPFLDPPAALNFAGWFASLLLALVWVAGLLRGRTVYDRLSGTAVAPRSAVSTREAAARL